MHMHVLPYTFMYSHSTYDALTFSFRVGLAAAMRSLKSSWEETST